MPRRTQPISTSDLEAIASQALQLSRSDRAELMAVLQAYNEAEDKAALAASDRERQKEKALKRRGIRGGGGSFEDKMINGYGPYRYLRYWYGKTHKSVYLGKVKSYE
jgi:hypothetical protein